MSSSLPPTLDPSAAKRFKLRQSLDNPAWLHGEVAKRMEQRLDWFKEEPTSWIDWEPLNGGLSTHKSIQNRYPKANSLITEPSERRLKLARQALTRNWISRYIPRFKDSKILIRGKQSFALSHTPSNTLADLVWANMLLHLEPNPTALIKEWHKSLRVGGWVMFSCLGPDTCKELRVIYEQLGWGVTNHDFTDMHDWGDMLVEAGFADPVMDMERITLTYSSPESLIQDLRTLGGNFNYKRYQALRGRSWLKEFKSQLSLLTNESLKIPLTFEIIYGHAFKVAPKIKVSQSSAFSAEDMRAMLKAGKI